MNHKYLHAINVWTKELDRLSWKNFFSHEKRCFELQSMNVSSSIANLKSQCLLDITLSGPQSSRRPGRMGGSGSSRTGILTDASLCILCLWSPLSLPGVLSLERLTQV